MAELVDLNDTVQLKDGQQQSDVRPIRILQMISALERGGGIESWIVEVVKHIDRKRFQFDFLVNTIRPTQYEKELESYGCRIFRCPGHHNVLIYSAKVRRVIVQEGPFDIIHSHHSWFSGPVLAIAWSAGVKKRIAHSHIDVNPSVHREPIYRRTYQRMMRWLILRVSTHRLAVSVNSAHALFGDPDSVDKDLSILPLGIDLSPFRSSSAVLTTRSMLGIPDNALVFGNIGRLTEQKNHDLMIQVASEAVRMNNRAHFLFLGEGHLRQKLEREVKVAGLEGHVTFAGVREDVPEILRGIVDVFFFPSLWEALGLAVVEAQAAGLPCVVSDTVPADAFLIPHLVKIMDLDTPAQEWASQLIALAGKRKEPDEALAILDASPLNIERSVEELMAYYLSISA